MLVIETKAILAFWHSDGFLFLFANRIDQQLNPRFHKETPGMPPTKYLFDLVKT